MRYIRFIDEYKLSVSSKPSSRHHSYGCCCTLHSCHAFCAISETLHVLSWCLVSVVSNDFFDRSISESDDETEEVAIEAVVEGHGYSVVYEMDGRSGG